MKKYFKLRIIDWICLLVTIQSGYVLDEKIFSPPYKEGVTRLIRDGDSDFYKFMAKVERVIEEYKLTGNIEWQELEQEVLIEAQSKLIEIAAFSLKMRISEFLGRKDNFKIPIPRLNNKNLESLISYWGDLSELIKGLDLEKISDSQFESEDYQIYATYWSIVLFIDICHELGFLSKRAEFNPANINNLAWEGSFGDNRLQGVIRRMRIIHEPFGRKESMIVASAIIHPVLIYLTNKDMVRIVGEENFEQVLLRLEKRVLWIRKMLKRHPSIPDKEVLLKHLKEEIGI